jgi:hypothetical protein
LNREYAPISAAVCDRPAFERAIYQAVAPRVASRWVILQVCALDMSSTQLLRINVRYLLISIESPSY